jgi:AbrB family looped-hinge helix DNA binding protein
LAVEFDVQLGKQGRVVIPSNIRKKFDIREGDWVRLVVIFETDNICKEAIIKRAMEC